MDPNITTDAKFKTYVSEKVLSFLYDAQIKHALEVLYPADYDGSQPYKSVQERLALFTGEAFISCNAHVLVEHSRASSYGYIFNIPPGLHGQDIAYSFYTPGLPAPFVETDSIATKMQGYLTRFAKTGSPNGDAEISLPEYREDSKVLDIKANSFEIARDDAANLRCQWWSKNI